MKCLLILAAALLLLALLLCAVPGYRFSMALCCGFALLLVLIWLLLKRPTPLTSGLLKAVWLCVAALALAAAVTFGFIYSAAHPRQEPVCSHIVVLGAGVNGTTPSLSLRERINAAYDYLSRHPDIVAVLSGGQGPGEEITEAACMYRELTAKGIDAHRLLLEEHSGSTIENLRFSLNLLEAEAGMRPQRIGIVSSEYHLFRAGLFAGELGLESCGIPAKTSRFTLRANYYLREVAAVWKYLIFGP